MPNRIYGIRCRENGRIYVGRTESPLNERFKKHVYKLNHNSHDSTSMQSDYNRYGKHSFDIFQIFQTDDYEYAKRLEKLVIFALKANTNDMGYNHQDPAFRTRQSFLTKKTKDEQEKFLRRRILNVVSGDSDELSLETGFPSETIKGWQLDPLSIRAIDLERLENLRLRKEEGETEC